MSVFNKTIFPSGSESWYASFILLFARIAFGGAFLSHGLQKWSNFASLSGTFPDPIGVGSQASLVLAIFAELFCPLALIFGFLHRLVLIPMLFTMFIAFFVIHGGDPFTIRELSFLYMVVFILLLLTGPGRLSIDSLIGRALNKRNRSYSPHGQTDLNYSK